MGLIWLIEGGWWFIGTSLGKVGVIGVGLSMVVIVEEMF